DRGADRVDDPADPVAAVRQPRGQASRPADVAHGSAGQPVDGDGAQQTVGSGDLVVTAEVERNVESAGVRQPAVVDPQPRLQRVAGRDGTGGGRVGPGSEVAVGVGQGNGVGHAAERAGIDDAVGAGRGEPQPGPHLLDDVGGDAAGRVPVGAAGADD